MKKILITGANSYIGTSFDKYMTEHFPGKYIIDTVDMIDGSWKQKSFSDYDVIYHVAGIAHRKETKENSHLYFEVNTDLAAETAIKAKADGVSRFVFLSSMSVYGCDTGVITKETSPSPNTSYGISKLNAEEKLKDLESDEFKVCIVRPPMVYGLGCKGNFNTVLKLVCKLPFFPKVNNRRSMIYIDNLSAFIKLLIDRGESGVFMPQNKEYTSTSHMASTIADALGKRIYLSRILGLGVLVLMPFTKIIKKAFGTLIYENTEDFDYSYCVVANDESYKLSAKGEKA